MTVEILTTEMKPITSDKFYKTEHVNIPRHRQMPPDYNRVDDMSKPTLEYDDYLHFIRNKLGNSVTDDILKKSINPIAGQKICELLRYNGSKQILEVGTYKGATLGLYKFILPDSEVLTIDPVLNQESVLISELYESGVEFHTGTIDNLESDKKFDFVLIDGDHTYDSCLNDWLNVQKFLADKAVICFDDIDHGAGCGNVFYEIVEQDNFVTELVEVDGYPYIGIVYYNKQENTI